MCIRDRYIGLGAAQQQNAAVRVIEAGLVRSSNVTNACDINYHGQNGGGVSGDNFGACVDLSRATKPFGDSCRGATNTLSAQFGSGSAGAMTDTGVH